MRRDLRPPEYNLTDAEIAALDPEKLESFAKRFVYGLGRASGIRMTPRSFDGTLLDRTRALGNLVLSADKQPPDSALGPRALELATELERSLPASTTPSAIVSSLVAYIDARIDVMAAGWVE